ncbi:MAG: Fis family transcriptional regulator [Verrucomicrobiales bacterium]|nr:Fis family transcriptional regulator [Verrucomicrobiales bacterium]|tara:strand:- start:25436 stop:26866 length:1431 start_codon:yes stop_codon:yes gene_type:complete
MARSTSILVIDPNPDVTSSIEIALKENDINITSAANEQSAIDELDSGDFDIVISDLTFDDGRGFSLLQKLQKFHPQPPFIALSDQSDSRSAIEAVKAGAFDFLPKPISTADLNRAIKEAIDCSRRASEPVAIDPRDEFSEGIDTLVGNSRAMLDVYKALGRVSATPVTVLIRGETGTGKELVARAIFQHGHRAHKPFITINCAAIPENLLESELFGHEKGSFTGAVATRVGKFEQANGATLFLDEIGDLNHSLQAKLLRVLQEKRFQRVGGSEEIQVDVRIIAATHRSLEKMIAEGDFREDLFYRLNVATIKLPPLRDRIGDIQLLTGFFLKRFSEELVVPPTAITRSAVSRLESSRLPGNVRQLQNIVRKALLRSRGYAIDRETIDELLVETEPPDQDTKEAGSVEHYCRQLVLDAADGLLENVHQIAVEKIEAHLIEAALDRSEGNISKASKWLGLSRLTLREKAKRYGIFTDR